jgi:hypothetical protein
VLTYGIFARVNLFSQNERASATSEWVLRKQINKCENTIQKHFPLLNLFILYWYFLWNGLPLFNVICFIQEAKAMQVKIKHCMQSANKTSFWHCIFSLNHL